VSSSQSNQSVQLRLVRLIELDCYKAILRPYLEVVIAISGVEFCAFRHLSIYFSILTRASYCSILNNAFLAISKFIILLAKLITTAFSSVHNVRLADLSLTTSRRSR
jgi:hypothetical protein